MNKLVATAALFAALTAPAAAAQINVAVFDNGVLVGSTTSSTGSFTLNASDANFDVLTLSGAGAPDLPKADLSTITLDVTSGAITATHHLAIDVFQTGVTAPASRTESTFTSNALVGTPGPTTESTFINGTTSTLGTLVETATFPAGTVDGSVGPLSRLEGAITADAEQYLIAFTAPNQSSNDTIQFETGIPEASTWAMLISGFALLGFAGLRNRLVNRIG